MWGEVIPIIKGNPGKAESAILPSSCIVQSWHHHPKVSWYAKDFLWSLPRPPHLHLGF